MLPQGQNRLDLDPGVILGVLERAPCTLPMWAEPGGVWEPSALGCRPPWPTGSCRACWNLPVAPGAESILERCTHREALMLGSRLPCLERKRESGRSVPWLAAPVPNLLAESAVSYDP